MQNPPLCRAYFDSDNPIVEAEPRRLHYEAEAP
jgi:hypothetical protein